MGDRCAKMTLLQDRKLSNITVKLKKKKLWDFRKTDISNMVGPCSNWSE